MLIGEGNDGITVVDFAAAKWVPVTVDWEWTKQWGRNPLCGHYKHHQLPLR